MVVNHIWHLTQDLYFGLNLVEDEQSLSKLTIQVITGDVSVILNQNDGPCT